MTSFNFITAAIVFFVGVFVSHIIAWRMIRPQRHMSAIFTNFVILPMPLLILGLYLLDMSSVEGVLACALYLALAAAYVQTYPAFQAISPSLKIVYHIGQSTTGMRTGEIQQVFPKTSLVADRLDDLLAEGLVTAKSNGDYQLSGKGKTLAYAFKFYRKFLGLSEGEG